MERLPHQPLEISSPALAEMLRRESEQFDDAEAYVKSLRVKYADEPLAKGMLRVIAQYIEASDSSLGTDTTYPTAWAFFKGGLLAMRVLETARGTDLFNQVNNTTIRTVNSNEYDDPRELLYHRQALLIQDGQKGYAEAGAYHEIFEDWEGVLSPNVRTQHFLKIGFGYIYALAGRAIAQSDIEAMQAAAGTTDWDNELARLLEPPRAG